MPSGPSGGPGNETSIEPGSETPSSVSAEGGRVRFWRAGTIVRLVFALALTALTFWASDPAAVLAAAGGAGRGARNEVE